MRFKSFACGMGEIIYHLLCLSDERFTGEERDGASFGVEKASPIFNISFCRRKRLEERRNLRN
jgi:hypothetical protein